MKKASVLIFALALLMMFMTVAPAIAIGPWQAWEVGNNHNLFVNLGALHNTRGGSGTPVLWVETSGFWQKWSFFDALSGQGKANNAIAATYPTLMQFLADWNAYMNGEPTVNENNWIYLSPESSGNQYNGHGMIWCLFFGISGSNAIASSVASLYPNGVYWKYNFIQ